MKIIEAEQRSLEWYKVRCGIPTASSFDKIVTTKGEPSKQAEKYMFQLAGERITGVSSIPTITPAMEWGIQTEQEARKYYEILRDCEVKEVGFCLDDSSRFGASPDGLIGDKGLLEIKCPQVQTHIGYLLEGKLPTEYIQQVQGQLLVTGREWCDFLSYYPGIKPLVCRIEANPAFQSALFKELNAFCDELDKTVERIKL